MRTTALVLALLFNALCLNHSSYAAELRRAEELVWGCSGQTTNPALANMEIASCVGYVGGWLDSLALLQGGGALKAPIVCLPPNGISNEQAIRIFVKWVNDHPRDMSEPARLVFLLSIRDAFPC
jgi:hypothetical protein